METLNRVFIHIICFLVPGKKLRKLVRRFLLKKSFFLFLKDRKKIHDLVSSPKRPNSILVVEGNMLFHSEILPAYVKYFNDLGYSCDVLLSNHNLALDPFCNSSHLNYKAYGFFYFDSLMKIFSLPKQIEKYQKILVTTTLVVNENGDLCDFVGAIGEKSNLYKDKICLMVHSLASIAQFNLQEYFDKNQAFVLSNFTTNNYPTLSPHYYGRIRQNKPKKNPLTFLSVGRIDSEVKNYELLLDATRKLLLEGFTNFKIVLIGWLGSIEIDQDLAHYIEIKVKAPFKIMHEEMENCDFLLSLLDPKHPKQILYSYDQVSGSNLLSLAFNKPYIINDIFASTSGFDSSSSVIYEGDKLFEAMKQALAMEQDEYNQLRINLEKLQKKLYEISVKNLQQTLSPKQ